MIHLISFQTLNLPPPIRFGFFFKAPQKGNIVTTIDNLSRNYQLIITIARLSCFHLGAMSYQRDLYHNAQSYVTHANAFLIKIGFEANSERLEMCNWMMMSQSFMVRNGRSFN